LWFRLKLNESEINHNGGAIMPTEFEYMQFATRVYAASTRNQIGIPEGWSLLDWVPDQFTGFSAGAFMNDNPHQIVISYTGTNDMGADPLNWTAGMGIPAPQIFEAMSYYFKFKKDHPGYDITFIGHSLGGGLASLMAVFFNKQATVFDEAPFQLAALSPAVLAGAVATMAASGVFDNDLALFLASNGWLALARESNVTQYSIEGEVLSKIRSSEATLVGIDNIISLGNSTASMVDRHSMALLTALKASNLFLTVAQTLPDLVTELLDKNLFCADSRDERKVDLLRKLLAHQLGKDAIAPDAMLSRFADDMQAIVLAGRGSEVNSDLTKALIAFGMQMYYDNPSATSMDKVLYTEVAGGLRFDRNDVASTLEEAKGYTNYFKNYLATLPENERKSILEQLPNLQDWFIQAGSQAMNAAAGDKRAFMLGGTGNDNLTGGSQADLLIGGTGYDTYRVDDGDTICDTGGKGEVWLDGQQLTYARREKGETAYKDKAGKAYILNNGTLSIDNQLVINGFANGDLGIILDERFPHRA
jgi:hypothetical protein